MKGWRGAGVRIAVRSLLRRPGFTATAVATLALGVGANAGLFSVVRRVVLAPLPLPEADRLVEIWESDATRDRRRPSPANFLDLREGTSAFTDLAAHLGLGTTLSGADTPMRLRGASVSSNFFRTLAAPAALGRTFDAGDPGDPREVVVSHGLWERAFGSDAGIVGRDVRLDGTSYRVVGVMPRGFAFPDGAEVWIRAPRDIPGSLGFTGDVTTVRDAWFHRVVGRLAPDVDPRAAQAQLDGLAARLEEAHPGENAELALHLTPLKEELVGPVRGGLLLLLGATGMVLLIACVNVANMLLVRLTGRRRELAVRRSLGADRRQIAAHVLGEALVLGVAGSGAGVGLALAGTWILGPRVEALLPPGTASVAVDSWALLYAAGLAGVSAVVSGALPAWWASREGRGGTARVPRGGHETRFASRAASGLVAAEVALAVTLVLGSVLLLRSLHRLGVVDPGFDAERVTLHSLALPAGESAGAAGAGPPGEADPERFGRLAREVAGLPGVAAVGWTQVGPLEVGPGAGLRTLDGGPGEWSSHDLPGVAWQVVDPGYFGALGVPLEAGRDFRASDDAGSEPVAIVNRSFARRIFGDGNPLGRRVNTGLDGRTPEGDWLWVRIVGVVDDTRNRGPASPPEPVLFRPLAQGGGGFRGETLVLVIREEAGAGPGLPALRDAVQAVLPGTVIFRTRRGPALVAPYAAERRVALALLAGFSALALALGVVGIHAVTTAAVARRRQEVGIRVALGADRSRVVGGVVGRGLIPVAVGVATGLLASAVAARALGDLLFQVSPLDPASFASVTILLLASALVATWLPARTAARIDPVRAIRGE